ncbi:MlaC/ttg2D family ABC transporter substrate-binding protein [Govanella unica]|uniref:ABC transporter substrate-binding protein n=1 Tax=Govanella unica TaxID=2975056 RepID=A0A9X3TWC3_9PROT|nr:ABC transporter substrate-binding protein [Govania unica]MDA5193190.1 ABC transporter substrate-binding protein [Govania unica]
MFIFAPSGLIPSGKRQSALALMMAGLLATAFVIPATAQTGSAATAPQATDAQAFIRKMADDSLNLIQDKSVTPDVRKAKLKAIFNEHVAMDYIATLALGRYGRVDPSLPAEARDQQAAQITEYRSLFPDFIFNKLYDILISKFDNSKIDVIGSKPIGNTDLYVNTRVNRPKLEPVLADWRVRNDKDGVIKVIDLKAEGVSLTITQRDEFAAILGSSKNINDGLAKLLTYMKDTNAGRAPAAPVSAKNGA